MADIFISYSREDREWVESFAAQLQSEGFSVWWDWDLLVGKRYRETIEHELQGCRVAVVVWSQHSIQSDFVRDEAEEAQQRNVLVPVLKEIVRPPAGFRQIQTADLSTWTGGGTHADFRRVMKGIANMVGKPSTEGWAESMPASARPAPQLVAAPPRMVPLSPNRQAITPLGAAGATQLLAKLPPPSHHLWRYAAFGIIALIGVILIITQFVSPNSKLGSVVNRNTVVNSNTAGGGSTAVNGNTAGTGNATPPQPPTTPADAGDIGQTGPHPPVSPPAGGNAGDSGDIGQGGTH